MKLGRLGVWLGVDDLTAAETAKLATRLEALGYAAFWIPEGFGRNVLVHASWLLANTKSLIIASGIANIYARDPIAMAAAQRGLNEQSGGRFLLGIGVSHARIVQDMRGHDYGKPVETMHNYLAAMKDAVYQAPAPAEPPLTIVAALRPKMIGLSGREADGAHPLNVTPEHTAKARAILGSEKMLCVEQKLILETDPAKARATARAALSLYFTLPNYLALWKELGFNDDDFSGGGSDRLVDAIVGWGDEAAIRQRIQAHFDAGATHVCFNPLKQGGGWDENIVELLAPANG